MTDSQIEQLAEKLAPLAKEKRQLDYTHWQYKLPGASVTAYTSGKVVFQGNALPELAEKLNLELEVSGAVRKTPAQNSWPQAGSDEVGTGDYFGPIVVAAVRIPEAGAARLLEKLGVNDSKKITDEKIREIAPQIRRILGADNYSVCVVLPALYNKVYDRQTNNANTMKARLHNQAYLNLIRKSGPLPELTVVDQFAPEKSYYAYLKDEKQIVRELYFEQKAESQYLPVAAASILARDAFLEAMGKLNEKYEFAFPFGGGKEATARGKVFVKRFGPNELKNVAKLHFVNTSRVLEASLD